MPADRYSLALKEALARSPRGVAARLAKLLDLDASFISQMKEGKRPVPAALAPVIAGELHVDASSISEEYARIEAAAAGHLKPISSHDATQAQALPNQQRRVRIEGSAAMDEQGFWVETQADSQVRYVEWSAKDGAYAILVDSDALDPVIRRGTVLIFEPVAPNGGEYVHLRLLDGRQAVLEFISATDGSHTFQTVRDRRRLTFSDAQISSIYTYGAQMPAKKLLIES